MSYTDILYLRYIEGSFDAKDQADAECIREEIAERTAEIMDGWHEEFGIEEHVKTPEHRAWCARNMADGWKDHIASLKRGGYKPTKKDAEYAKARADYYYAEAEKILKGEIENFSLYEEPAKKPKKGKSK